MKHGSASLPGLTERLLPCPQAPSQPAEYTAPAQKHSQPYHAAVAAARLPGASQKPAELRLPSRAHRPEPLSWELSNPLDFPAALDIQPITPRISVTVDPETAGSPPQPPQASLSSHLTGEVSGQLPLPPSGPRPLLTSSGAAGTTSTGQPGLLGLPLQREAQAPVCWQPLPQPTWPPGMEPEPWPLHRALCAPTPPGREARHSPFPLLLQGLPATWRMLSYICRGPALIREEPESIVPGYCYIHLNAESQLCG